MKSFIRTIIVLGVLGLAMGNFAPAQDPLDAAPEEAVPETSELSVSPSRPATRPSRVVAPTPPVEPIDTVVALGIEPAGLIAVPPGQYVATSVARGRTTGRKTLIIPAEEVKAEDLAAIWQDLCVMSRIFDKKFSKGSRLIRGVFPDYGEFFGRDSRSTEAIYIQGYGALFLMQVNFPLTAPPKPKEKEAKKTEEPADPIWQRAKQEIFDPMIRTTRRIRISQPREKYDAEQIEEVKKELVKSLKHAANIRNLKSDEWVILTVTGAGRQPNEVFEYGRLIQSNGATGSAYYRGGAFPGGGGGGYGGSYSETGSPSAMVLTIRAKKADVDAFAKGELDYEKFREKVQMFTYPSLGQKVGRANRIIRQLADRQLAEPPQEPVVPEPPAEPPGF